MALDVRTLYCKLVNNRYDTKSHAFWPSDPVMKLGDYGTFDGIFFDRVGNIFDDGLAAVTDYPVNVALSATTDQIFTYGCQYGLKAGGAMPNTVTVQVDFALKESLLIYMHNLKTSSLNGIRNLQDRLKALWEQGTWSREHIVITELTTADNLHYYAYAGGKGSIDLRANVSPDSFNIKHDFGHLEISANAGIKTDLFHECTFANDVVFLYKAKKLVRPILDLLGNPRLETRTAQDSVYESVQHDPTSSGDLILGDI